MMDPHQKEQRFLIHPQKLIDTIKAVKLKLERDFPGSGLARLCGALLLKGEEVGANLRQITRPVWLLRLLTWGLALLIPCGIGFALYQFQLSHESISFADFVNLLESGTNETFLVSAFLFFLITFEQRVKRDRAMRSLHELRSIAHVIDMHQLGKDPASVSEPDKEISKEQTVKTSQDLRMYLDGCSEMLSLTGKIAAMYLNRLSDPSVVNAVNDIEQLTTGLSRKIWQKILLSQSERPAGG